MTNDIATQPAQSGPPGKLDSLANYLGGLWKIGGLPLAMIGLGAANLFIPSTSAYSENKQIVITILLFSSGVIAWGSLVFLAFRRWQSELQFAIQQDATVIAAVVKLVENIQSDAAAKERVKIFTDSLGSLRATAVQPLALPGQGSNP